MASNSNLSPVTKRITESVSSSTQKGILRLPANILKIPTNKIPSNLTSARIIKLPSGVVLLKSPGTVVPGKNAGTTSKQLPILKLQYVKPNETVTLPKKGPVVLFNSVKQGIPVVSKQKEPPSVSTAECQKPAESSVTAVAGVTVPDQKRLLNPSWQDHSSLVKSKEPVVLYSGCKPEDLEPKKKKDPPESLPCPQQLKDILPEPWNYHISSFEELKTPGNFKAEVRVGISKKEDALQWLQDFEVTSGTNFRIAKTFKENSTRVIFKKCYKCHKNTSRRDRVPRRESKRNLGCQARLIITVKNRDMRTSADMLLAEFPCVVGIYHNHCHSLSTPETLRHRRPLPEVREKLAHMFQARITPSAALRLHLADLKRSHGDKYPEVIQDGARCPTLSWCYRLYYETVGKKVKDGKKRSSKRTYKKRSANALKNETSPATVNFTSLDGVSTTFTISVNDKNVPDEIQNSIDSLYEYEFMSKSNEENEGQLIKTVEVENDSENVQILSNSESVEIEENCESVEIEENCESVEIGDNCESVEIGDNCESVEIGDNCENVLVLDNGIEAADPIENNIELPHEPCVELLENHEETLADDYIDDSEMLENDGSAEEFEETCETLNSDVLPDVGEETKEQTLCNSTSLKQHHRLDVEQVKQDLHRVFNDISSKLLSEPGKYLSAVRQFTSQYDKCCQAKSNPDPVTALNEFGSNLSSDSNRFSSLVERLIDSKDSSSVCPKPPNLGSPKRKVLVLRMDPNKFNQILGRVGNKNSKTEVVNI